MLVVVEAPVTTVDELNAQEMNRSQVCPVHAASTTATMTAAPISFLYSANSNYLSSNLGGHGIHCYALGKASSGHTNL